MVFLKVEKKKKIGKGHWEEMKLANVELLAENLIVWDAILKILMMSKNYLHCTKKIYSEIKWTKSEKSEVSNSMLSKVLNQ